MTTESTPDSLDSYLIAVNIALLTGFLFVFQSTLINDLVKWTLLISLILFIISLLLLLWHKFRYPKRLKLLDSLREKTTNKFSERIASFIEDMVLPFTRLKAKDDTLSKLVSVKTKEEYDQVMSNISQEIEDLETGKAKGMSVQEEKATRLILESFLGHMASDTKDDINQAFKSPLKESCAKPKYYIDRIAFKYRRHIFASASVFIVFAILIQILNQ